MSFETRLTWEKGDVVVRDPTVAELEGLGRVRWIPPSDPPPMPPPPDVVVRDVDGAPSVAIREHGELGPVLTNAAHDFKVL